MSSNQLTDDFINAISLTNSPSILLVVAENLYELECYKTVIAILHHCLYLEPSNHAAFLPLARSFLALG